MTRSANEVMVLATKAARGAGAPPAQAAQFGAAAVVHICAGRGYETLDAALEQLPNGPICEMPLAIARIAEGASRLDMGVDGLFVSYLASLPYHAQLSEDGVLTLDVSCPARRDAVKRIDLPDEIYDRWNALAARLLVPESEASRLSGAGAGISDND